MRRFCCLCVREKLSVRTPQKSSSSIDVTTTENAKRGSANENVERQVEAWESEIREYYLFEEEAVDELGYELANILDSLRSNPMQYFDHDTHLVRDLAQRRFHILEVEDSLKRLVKDTEENEAMLPLQSKRISEHLELDEIDKSIKSENKSTSVDGREGKENKRALHDIWAGRLADIVPTQGVLRETTEKDGTKVLKIKPKWPEWLVDESFEVCKYSKYGKRMRVLKLTEYHILAIRGGKEITKSYSYLDVCDVLCTVTIRGPIVYLKFKDGRSFYYGTQFAAHIAQQITTRMQVRSALESAVMSVPIPSNVVNITCPSGGNLSSAFDFRSSMSGMQSGEQINFSVETIRALIDSISEENSKSGSSNIIEFAKSLHDRVIPKKQPAASSAVSSLGTKSNAETVSTTLSPMRESQKNVKARMKESGRSSVFNASWFTSGEKQKPIDPEKWAKRLMVIEAHSPENMVQEAVRKILFDTNTPEGATRKAFLDTFGVSFRQSSAKDIRNANSSSSTLSVRQWIEGMHGYLVKERGIALAILLIQSEQSMMLQNGSAVSQSAKILSQQVPQSVNAVINFAGRANRGTNQFEQLYKVPAIGLNESVIKDFSDLDENALTSISYIAFVAIEESVYLPLQTILVEALSSGEQEMAERLLAERFRILSTKSQVECGVPESHVSSLGWSNASFELAGIERNPTPSTKLQAVVRAAKAIFSEYAKEVVPRLMSLTKKSPNELCLDGKFLGADDLLPIFIYVLCRSNLQTPLRNKDLLWSLCHPDQLYGEPGYYLTIYESAVAYIQDLGDDLKVNISEN